MITLYQFQTSPFVDKVTRILNYKGLEFDVVEVPRDKIADYKHVTPFGKLPAMEIDGKPVCDSTDIAHALEAYAPEKPLIPEDAAQAAMVHVLEDWADESLYFYEVTMRLAWEHNGMKTLEKFLPTFPPGLTVEQAAQAFFPPVQQLVAAQGLGRKKPEQVVEDCRRHFVAIDRLLADSDWLVGDSITLADIAVYSQLKCILDAEEAQEMITAFPAIPSWMERLEGVAPRNV